VISGLIQFSTLCSTLTHLLYVKKIYLLWSQLAVLIDLELRRFLGFPISWVPHSRRRATYSTLLSHQNEDCVEDLKHSKNAHGKESDWRSWCSASDRNNYFVKLDWFDYQTRSDGHRHYGISRSLNHSFLEYLSQFGRNGARLTSLSSSVSLTTGFRSITDLWSIQLKSHSWSYLLVWIYFHSKENERIVKRYYVRDRFDLGSRDPSPPIINHL
jgi:hypothetical protein